MGNVYAQVMFSEEAKKIQAAHGSRAAYERMAAMGESQDALSVSERTFIEQRDSCYVASVSANGWPYMQHRGGPMGFVRVMGARTLAFADFAGNKQYISAGNLVTGDKVSLFFMSYPLRARLKVIGHARVVDLGADAALEAAVAVPGYGAKVERVVVIEVVAFDWNCSQHITERWSESEWKQEGSGRP